MRGIALSIALVFLLALGMPAQASGPALSAAEEARYQQLINQLRCLVCQNQTIAESNAPLAQDLRQQVHDMIKAGQDDAAILDFLTQRYGDFVLYRPPVKRMTWLLWGGPFALLVLALIVALSVFRRRPASARVPVDQEALRRLLGERKP